MREERGRSVKRESGMARHIKMGRELDEQRERERKQTRKRDTCKSVAVVILCGPIFRINKICKNFSSSNFKRPFFHQK